MSFLIYFLIWWAPGLLAAIIGEVWDSNKGTCITYETLLKSLVASLAGPLTLIYLIILFLAESIKWDTVVFCKDKGKYD